MRKITKLLTLALAALMIMSVMPVSAAFTDVSVDDEALSDAVELLSTLGVAKGTTDTTFGPEELVTRQQMAAFVYRLMKAGRSSEGGVNTTAFADLEDSTFFNMISWAANAGIIKGTSATTFNPKGNITLQDAYVMVVRALGYEKDGALVYPHGYVDQAEALGLDEDIPSSVNYTDNLNRGQVAIILANAFYAEMNEKTVKYDWVYDEAEENAAYVAKEVTTTIAEKIFGVVEETLVVKATTHYSFDGAEVTYDEKNAGVEFVYGDRFDAEGKKVETAEYELVKDLGLAGAADDYFMAEITLFVKKDADDVADDEILAAKSNLVKKTVKADKVVLERSTKSGEEYYIEGDKENEKVLTGYAEFDGIKAYLDINVAPRSVDKEEVASLKFINLTAAKWDEDGNNTFAYVETDETYEGAYGLGTDGEVYDALDIALADNAEAAMYRVYTEGLYEADVYDVDGDNYADYLFVKNYDFAKIADKKGTKYAASKFVEGIYNIYTNEVVIDGEYTADDYVLVYAPHKDIQYIKVAGKVESFDSKVTGKSASAETFTFANGTVINYADNEAKGGIALESTDFTTGKEYTVFVKDGVVLYSGNISEIEFDTEASYALVTGEEIHEEDEDDYHEIFNQDTGKSTYYVNAIIDGESKNVKLGTTVNVYVDGKLTSKKLNKETIKTYFGKGGLFNEAIAIYKVVDGAYVFTEVRYDAINDVADDTYTSDDAASVLYTADNVIFKNVSGSIYTEVSDKLEGIERFYVKNFTKFILRTEDKKNPGEHIWTVYTAETLPKFAETTFTNVKAVFVNNTASKTTEDLVLFYADATKFGSGAAVEDYYKVVGKSERADEEDNAEIVYTLVNIKTGEKKNDVLAADETDYALNEYVQLDKVGEIDGVVTTTAGSFEDYVLVTGNTFADYDADSNFLTLVGDDQYYVLGENVTVFIYNSYKDYLMADVDALDTEANPYESLEDVNDDYDDETTEKKLGFDFIGEEDKNNEDLIVITSIVLYTK